MVIQLDVMLQRISLIQISASLWNAVSSEKLIKELFLNSESKYKNQQTWQVLIDNVVNRIEPLKIPDKMKLKLSHAVIAMGSKIYDWYVFLFGNYSEHSTALIVCAKQPLYWTVLGSIDDVTTFKQWIRNQNIDFCFRKYIACEYYFGAHKKIVEELNIFEGEIGLLEYIGKYNFYIENHLTKSTTEFINNFTNQNLPSVKFLWFKMCEHNLCIYELSEKIIKKYADTKMEYEREKFFEILIFLINKMGNDEVWKLLQNYWRVFLSMYLKIWPWRDLFMSLVERVEQCKSGPSDLIYAHKFILYEISKVMLRHEQLESWVELEICQKYFVEVWNQSSEHVKNDIRNVRKIGYHVIKNLLQIMDLKVLNLIYTCADAQIYRKKLVEVHLEVFRDFLKYEQFRKVEEFKTNFLCNDEELKYFHGLLNYEQERIKVCAI